MPSKKPTLLIVHGAWHSPEAFHKVNPRLEAQGYKVVAPQVVFCGTEKPVSSITDAIDQIQALITTEVASGNDVVVICHSFGGNVGCSAVQGLTGKDPSRLPAGATGKVVGLILLCAFMIPSNTSQTDVVGKVPNPIAAPDADGWEAIVNGDPVQLFYQDLPLDEARIWVSKLKKHSSSTFSTRERVYAGWMDVPVWYLFCSEDGAIPYAFQQGMVAEGKSKGATVTTRELQSGHSPFLSMPEETAAFIVEAAGQLAV